jgi:hypothetical protein
MLLKTVKCLTSFAGCATPSDGDKRQWRETIAFGENSQMCRYGVLGQDANGKSCMYRRFNAGDTFCCVYYPTSPTVSC